MIGAIVGLPGDGKTATLTYLAINYFQQDYDIYANYFIGKRVSDTDIRPLGKLVLSQQDLDNIRNGFFMGDELWSWVDSRMTQTQVNKFINSVLLKSRKRGFSLIYTTQSLHQIDKRIRDITDYVLVPTLFKWETHKFRAYDKGKEKICESKPERCKIEQDFLKPVSLIPIFDKVHVDVQVFSMGAYLSYQSGYNIEPLTTFEFHLATYAQYYDTTEEVQQLLQTEVDKGISFEKEFADRLKELYPDDKIELVKHSGQYQDSFDIEMTHNNKLKIFDFCSVATRKNAGKEYCYLGLNHKNAKKYKDIEKKRDATCYFSFSYQDKYYAIPSSVVWGMHPKSTISLNKILPAAQTIESLL